LSTLLKNIKSVLIIRSGALGDLIYATSIIDALVLEFGNDIKIDMVVNPNVADVLKNDTRLRRLYPLKHRKVPIFLSFDKINIIKHAKKTPYDLLINLEQNRHFDNLAKKIDAKRKLGSPFTKTKLLPGQHHMVDIIKQFAAPICQQQTLDRAAPKLFGTPWEKIKSDYDLPENYLVFNPSNSHANRNKINYRAWPQEHWKKLLEMIPSHIPIVIIAGKGEEAYFEPIKPYPSNVIDLAGKTPLTDLIGVIEHAEAIVTTDTGPAHLASAVNTDIFVLIGPTPAARTGPYKTNDNNICFINMNLACSPCYNTPTMFACKENICMQEITPKHVYEQMQKTIDIFNH
jgi:ADP-heptose:LPS heptosyltransferase